MGSPPAAATPSLRRDILSAYLASATRILSWVAVSALAYRYWGPRAFAMVALARATVGIFSYTSLGLGPAMIHYLAKLRAAPPVPAIPIEPAGPGGVLPYHEPSTGTPVREATPVQRLYYSGLLAGVLLGLAGLAVLTVGTANLEAWVQVPKGLRTEAPDLMVMMGLGILLRIVSDASGAVLQTSGRLWLDNLLLAVTDVTWLALVWAGIRRDDDQVALAGAAFAGANLALLVLRFIAAEAHARLLFVKVSADLRAIGPVLGYGMLVTLAQVADFLYAPTDFILINRLIPGANALAAYAPAVQIDAGLLVVVSGLAAVLLPRAALAHAGGDVRALRNYYLRGTLASAALLLAAALLVWLLGPWIMHLWLGHPVPGTLDILPWVLVHTVIGGSSAVGRSILLGMGRVKAFTAAALLAGLANVLLSYAFVRYLDLGLRGIVLGTIVVVTARCALWMPWYVLRSLRQAAPARITDPELASQPAPTV